MSAITTGTKNRAWEEVESPSVSYLVNADGLMLYCERWEPQTSPRALAFIAHGFAEHIGYYKELAQDLMNKSLYVFAHDHIGHGRSEGVRVYVEKFSDYVRDVFQHIDLIHNKYPTLPVFIIGHSMGGTIAIKAAMQRPEFFRGVVLIGPAVVPNPDLVSPVKVFLAKALARVIPRCPVSILEYETITRDKTMVEYMKKDNLRHHGFANAKWVTVMLETLQDIYNNLKSVSWPFLVLHGDQDKIVDVSGSKALYSLAMSKDKAIKIYKDAYHNLICEMLDIKQETLKEINEWIIPRISKPI